MFCCVRFCVLAFSLDTVLVVLCYIYCCQSIMQQVIFLAAKYNAVCSIIAAEYSAVRVTFFAAE